MINWSCLQVTLTLKNLRLFVPTDYTGSLSKGSIYFMLPKKQKQKQPRMTVTESQTGTESDALVMGHSRL